MDKNEIKSRGKKLLSFEHRSASGDKKELLGFYHVPNPNSPMNKIIRYMGKVLNPTNTENNYSNMHKKYAAQGAKNRAKIAKGLRKAGSSPDNQRNVP